ncbi:MAG: formylglycine-generating enzyme family protein [Magnetococcales bacterium]|nr:formylglycine-generating enzyme family protein [Magnetococcales bacterium]
MTLKKSAWIFLTFGLVFVTTPIQGEEVDCWSQPSPQKVCQAHGLEFVFIPGGRFLMGSPSGEEGRFRDEGPLHEVKVEPFWMGKYEVTNAQYRKWRPDHDSGKYDTRDLNGDNQPAVRMNWNEAVDYTKWLSEKGNGSFYLPTEAEWEYAARAGTQTSRYWGDDPNHACEYANVHDQSSQRVNLDFIWKSHSCEDHFSVSAPVGSYKPNSFGLYDMLGNVWEWSCSEYVSSYDGSEQQCAHPDSDGKARVIRGGGWEYHPDHVRSANRFRYLRNIRNLYTGFRIARKNS